MRILVTGLLGQYAFGGVTWDYLQYAMGFRALGHEVWYLEDTATWAYDPIKGEPSADCSYNVNYLRRIMEEFGFGDRWIYRNEADGSYHGVTDPAEAERIIRGADVLVNVSGACWLREPTFAVRCKLFVDGDPMFTHIGLATGAKPDYIERVKAHNAHFTFGLNVGRTDCRVPTGGLVWQPTVQPIALEHWTEELAGPMDPGHPASGAWTTVMNWASYKPLEFQGEFYGQKDLEFRKFINLPSHASRSMKWVVAMGQGIGQQRPTAQLEQEGWTVLEPDQHLPDHLSYRRFLAHSRAEWSIAKNGYVASRSGWFSCRSACYLALGRPVVVQDTGWSEHLPHGEGVMRFTSMEDCVSALAAVEADYPRHSEAARAYARKWFDAARVCDDLLVKAGAA
jgi:hypothetical protein